MKWKKIDMLMCKWMHIQQFHAKFGYLHKQITLQKLKNGKEKKNQVKGSQKICRVSSVVLCCYRPWINIKIQLQQLPPWEVEPSLPADGPGTPPYPTLIPFDCIQHHQTNQTLIYLHIFKHLHCYPTANHPHLQFIKKQTEHSHNHLRQL